MFTIIYYIGCFSYLVGEYYSVLTLVIRLNGHKFIGLGTYINEFSIYTRFALYLFIFSVPATQMSIPFTTQVPKI